MRAPKKRAPKVFISYFHESSEFMNAALRLANNLRRAGIDCEIDQYHEAPSNGWTRWMVNQIEKSDYVISIWSKNYLKRFKGEEKGGSEVEGKLITTEYLSERKREKYIPVILSPKDREFVPTMFKDVTIYDLSKGEDYVKLLNHLTGQVLVKKPKLGEMEALPSIIETEFPLLEKVIDDTPTVTVKGIDGQRYAFHLFPFGERGSKMSEDLRNEIIKGLVKLVNEIDEEYDYIIGIKEGGFAWAEHVAHTLGKTTNAFYEKETEREGKNKEPQIKGERSVHLKTILYEKDLYYRDVKANDRVIIIDDVISSGQTMKTIIDELKKRKVHVLAAICIVAKTDGYKIIEAEGVPVRWLQYVRGLA